MLPFLIAFVKKELLNLEIYSKRNQIKEKILPPLCFGALLFGQNFGPTLAFQNEVD